MTLVTLRAVLPTDLPDFFESNRDPVAVHMAAFTAADPDNRAAFDAHWSRILANESVLIRSIVVNGRLAGNVSSYQGESGPEVSYWLGREFWGRGIATAALAEFLRHQPQRPIYARVAADNLASLAVLRKCGFTIVGQGRGYANGRRAEIDELLLRLL